MKSDVSVYNISMMNERLFILYVIKKDFSNISDGVWGDILIEIILLFVWSFAISLILLYLHIRMAHKIGWLSPDAHKKEETYVVDRGGVILFLIPVIALPVILIDSEYMHVYMALSACVILGALTGFIDDFKDMGLKKAIIVIVAALPIILLGVYYPRPYIPFIGRTRMTLVYPLFIMVLFSVMADACNMIDIYNGILVLQGLAILVPLLIIGIVGGYKLCTYLVLVGIGYTVAFLIWNKYPARVFHGNVGAYGYGSMLAAIIVLSGLEAVGIEFISIIGFLPAVFNGFIYVFNTRFAPRSRVAQKKKSNFFKDGYLVPNIDPDAAVDLSRLFLLHGKMTEKDLINAYMVMFIISGVLSLATGLLILHGII